MKNNPSTIKIWNIYLSKGIKKLGNCKFKNWVQNSSAGKYIISGIYEKTNNQKILKNSNKSTRKNMVHLDLKRTKYLEMSQK